MIRELIDDIKQMNKDDCKAGFMLGAVWIVSMVLVGLIERW